MVATHRGHAVERQRAARAIDVAVTVDEVAAAQDPLDLLGRECGDGDAEALVFGVHVADQTDATHHVRIARHLRLPIVHDREPTKQRRVPDRPVSSRGATPGRKAERGKPLGGRAAAP